jgi:hypothetical protein
MERVPHIHLEWQKERLITWFNEEVEKWNRDMGDLVEREKTWWRNKSWEQRWKREMHGKFTALNKARMDLFLFEKSVKEFTSPAYGVRDVGDFGPGGTGTPQTATRRPSRHPWKVSRSARPRTKFRAASQF